MTSPDPTPSDTPGAAQSERTGPSREETTDVPDLSPTRSAAPGDGVPARASTAPLRRSVELVRTLRKAEESLPALLDDTVAAALAEGTPVRDKNAVLKTVADLTLIKERAARELGLDAASRSGSGGDGEGMRLLIDGQEVTIEMLRNASDEEKQRILLAKVNGTGEHEYTPKRSYEKSDE